MKPSTIRVAEVNPDAVARYKEMRNALMDSIGEDRRLCEIVITSQLALLGHENAFKVHVMRLLEMNVSRSQLERVILAGLGVTFLMPQAAQALDWTEQVYEKHQAANAVRSP